jgi:hypothetical protein
MLLALQTFCVTTPGPQLTIPRWTGKSTRSNWLEPIIFAIEGKSEMTKTVIGKIHEVFATRARSRTLSEKNQRILNMVLNLTFWR